MLSFFKRKGIDDKVEKRGLDTTFNSKEIVGGPDVDTKIDVQTNLYLAPQMQVSLEDRYYFQFLHNELPPLKENQISIAGIELKFENNGIHVLAFVRHTVEAGIRLNEFPLTFLGPNNERLGSRVFNLSNFGTLPGNTSTPFLFAFEQSDLISNDIPSEGWKLAFETTPAHRLDLAETWEQHLSQEDKDKLTRLIQTIEPPKSGEVNMYGLSGKMNPENGNLHITLLIRNGNGFDIDLEQLPLFVEDASGEVVAKGVFNLENFKVKAFASKPWTFVFPKEMITVDSPNLSSWRAFPPQQEK